jgi:hypothetical protein
VPTDEPAVEPSEVPSGAMTAAYDEGCATIDNLIDIYTVLAGPPLPAGGNQLFLTQIANGTQGRIQCP